MKDYIREIQERYYKYTMSCILYGRKRLSFREWKDNQEKEEVNELV